MDKALCLAAHNQHRQRHGASPLVWSDKLARHAAKQAESCSREYEPYYGNAAKYEEGQNLYECQRRGEGICDAIHDWYSQGHDYDWNTHATEHRHFSQILWAQTSKVGAAISADGKYILANYDVEADPDPKQRPKFLFANQHQAAAHSSRVLRNKTALPGFGAEQQDGVIASVSNNGAAPESTAPERIMHNPASKTPCHSQPGVSQQDGTTMVPGHSDHRSSTLDNNKSTTRDKPIRANLARRAAPFGHVPGYQHMIQERQQLTKLVADRHRSTQLELVVLFDDLDHTDSGFCPRTGLLKALNALPPNKVPMLPQICDRLSSTSKSTVTKQEFLKLFSA
eukprot:TRINITY_DN4194_c0_g1_i4.p1 TRINITY_DN4194_c0_g1~~TRINITY_DN4194_c0_g1_i4.p1  ORF type:complete len:339 (+),score=44.96 TRINITY_DN4194_c0_g1_i4:241-1257(+)